MSGRPQHGPVDQTSGFTLIELVIVVVIIGVIAGIAIPRFGKLASGADSVALLSDLRTLRGSIQMYAAEHGGVFPALDKKKETFVAQLTAKTDADGNVGTTLGVHIFGPYLHDPLPAIPVGPNVGATEVKVTDKNPLAGEVNEGKTNRAWVYHHLTGEIIANTDDLDDDGKPYTSY